MCSFSCPGNKRLDRGFIDLLRVPSFTILVVRRCLAHFMLDYLRRRASAQASPKLSMFRFIIRAALIFTFAKAFIRACPSELVEQSMVGKTVTLRVFGPVIAASTKPIVPFKKLFS